MALDKRAQLAAEEKQMAVRGREQGANVVELPMSGDADVGFIFRLAALLKQLKPDLVHVHSRRGADVWGGLGAKWAGVPAVLSRRVESPIGRESAKLRCRGGPRQMSASCQVEMSPGSAR